MPASGLARSRCPEDNSLAVTTHLVLRSALLILVLGSSAPVVQQAPTENPRQSARQPQLPWPIDLKSESNAIHVDYSVPGLPGLVPPDAASRAGG
jgi:hypothetical protein